MPVIDQSRCDGCGVCITVCARGGLTLVNGVVAIVPGVECDYCTMCEAVCVTGAIACPFEIVIEGL